MPISARADRSRRACSSARGPISVSPSITSARSKNRRSASSSPRSRRHSASRPARRCAAPSRFAVGDHLESHARPGAAAHAGRARLTRDLDHPVAERGERARPAEAATARDRARVRPRTMAAAAAGVRTTRAAGVRPAAGRAAAWRGMGGAGFIASLLSWDGASLRPQASSRQFLHAGLTMRAKPSHRAPGRPRQPCSARASAASALVVQRTCRRCCSTRA
jgi:hypothetical protein